VVVVMMMMATTLWTIVEFWKVLDSTIKSSVTLSIVYYLLKQHKPVFDEQYSELVDQREKENCSGCRNHGNQMEIT